MKNKIRISLLGCGWLSFPLARDLIRQGFPVKGSTTSLDKISLLKEAGIEPVLVQFENSLPPPDLKVLLDAEVLIVSIPPGRRTVEGPENYLKMGETLAEHLPASCISKLIFISSTSVYPETNEVLHESSPISPETVSAKVIADVEEKLLSLPMQVIVLRLAGLFGPGRSPGRFFAGKSGIPNGLAPVNMIHLDEVIALINALIDSDNAKGIYIGSTPSHPSREEFYTLAAKLDNLERPIFISEKLNWKIVESERVEKELGFSFKNPNLLDSLRQG
ncbi:MAG: SDR family oxidoreductase [Bacteroidetes bacterium]|nr:SDR family oxidoreductase [Bacteroidota bacterium]